MKTLLAIIMSIVMILPIVAAPTAPAKVSPILECVAMHDEGYTAYFGYKNPNDFEIQIPIGNENKITGGGNAGMDQGQPTTFAAGRTAYYPDAEFSVDFDGNNMVWTLNGKTATASKNSQRCQEPVDDVPEFGALAAIGIVALAGLFIYKRRN